MTVKVIVRTPEEAMILLRAPAYRAALEEIFARLRLVLKDFEVPDDAREII